MKIWIYWQRIAAHTQAEMRKEGESAGRRLLRSILYTQYGISDVRPQIEIGRWGKPLLIQHPEIVFNISDSGDMVAVAISKETGGIKDVAIGLDIEQKRSIPMKLMQRFYHPAELAWVLETEDPAEQQQRALELWTQKEAYGKWQGSGLHYQMQQWNVREPHIQSTMLTRWKDACVWSVYTNQEFTISWKEYREKPDGFI